ncbi:MAG: TonB-dependent receptor [Tannerellaceae bacterium]|jgi:TonB-linked SusC/RagA family outer membrane protein|nr:TonB-dependent receptor [Tannerellaceae bacterium]
MRITTLFLTICISYLAAENSYAQLTHLSLKTKEATFLEIFDEIENKSEFIFFYHDDVLDLNRKVRLNIKNQPVDKILDNLFKGTNITYTIEDRQISLFTRNESAQQPSLRITGRISDENGEPLIGVNIQEEGTTNGVVTDINGNFTIYNVSGESATLVFSYIGYISQKIVVGNQRSLNIRMLPDTQNLEEVVVVGFGLQKRESVIGAISTVKPSTFQVSQSRSITNNLAGQIAGVIAVQRTGEPGYDTSEFWIRGINTFGANATPLVLVDGVERSLNDISPEEIESFSVLKDATATAVYGVRGANGVILIQTKKGQIGKTRISVKIDHGISAPTQLPEFVDGAKYMEVVNAARILSNAEGQGYSAEDIEKTRTGADPDLFPNMNWLEAVTRSYAPNNRVSLDVNGGSELLRYSLVLSYYGEEGIIKKDRSTDYDSQLKFQRYNVRSNVDINLTSSTLLNVSIGGYIKNRNAPSEGINSILDAAFLVTPIIYPAQYSNGQLANRTSGNNPWAMATQHGYKKRYESSIQSTMSIEQNIGKLYSSLEGLKLKALFSFDAWNWSDINRGKVPTYYSAYGRDDNGDLLTSLLNEGQEFLGFSKGAGGNRAMYIETQLNYNRRFDDHLVDALFLYNMRDYVDADADSGIKSLPYRNQGISGRLSYSYADKYFVEANFGYNGSENFQKGYRFGFFPSIAMGWMISNESFMKNISGVLSKLKIRGSWGLVGNDQLGGRRFAYVSTINNSNGYKWGYTGSYSQSGKQEGDFGIPNLTWETSEKINLGLEIGLFSWLNMQVDVFKENRRDIFMQRKTIPEIAGYNIAPWANFGKVTNKGIDMNIEMNHKFNKDLLISTRGNFTFARNKVIEYDEPEGLKGTTRAQTGQPLRQHFGLIADGLYTKDDFTDGVLKSDLPRPTFGDVAPGDIKYIDINEDGKIDAFDKCPIGRPWVPEIVYGFGVNLKYKNVDFGIFFQGAGNFTNMLKGNNLIPASGGGGLGNIYSNVDDRWTEENPRQDVFWPRLSFYDSENNKQESTWWLKNASYLRLKNLEIGYTLPRSWQKKVAMRNARIYARGSNLLTWAPFDMWDPEIGSSNGLTYPTMKIISIGLEITF